MYYERKEPVTTIPSHRVLAIRRGCKEGILISSIEGDNAKALDYLLTSIIKDKDSIFAPILEIAARESYSRILRPLIETEVRTQLKERADREAIRVFQENLANLLLSPPAGPIVVMGVDWGKGDDCSVSVVNETGQFLEGAKIRFKPAPERPAQKAPQTAAVNAIGTRAGRRTASRGSNGGAFRRNCRPGRTGNPGIACRGNAIHRCTRCSSSRRSYRGGDTGRGNTRIAGRA